MSSTTSQSTVQARKLLVPHEVFQRRCEENTAWYVNQLHQSHNHITAAPTESPRRIVMPGTSSSANEPLTVFHSKVLPQLSLFELGCALGRASKCGEEALLIAMVLMSRYCASTRTKPTAHMMHRLYVACLQVGMKAHSDVYYRNDTYARLAGISYLEMNRLENEVITGLKWSVQVTKEEIDAMLIAPEETMSKMAPAALFYADTQSNAAAAVRASVTRVATPQVSPVRNHAKRASSSSYMPESPKSAAGSAASSPAMANKHFTQVSQRTPQADLNGSSVSFADWNRAGQRSSAFGESRGLSNSLTSP